MADRRHLRVEFLKFPVLAVALPVLACASPIYTITQVGPTDLGVYVGGLNDSGQVVVTFGGPDDELYSGGTYTDLGYRSGGGIGNEKINNAGQITGSVDTASYPFGTAFLYGNGTLTQIAFPGQSTSAGAGINNSGEVVGTAWDITPYSPVAFTYSNGASTLLLPPGASLSYGYAINDAGVVLGSTYIAADGYVPFTYSNGSYTLYPGNMSLVGINNNGAMTGQITVGSQPGQAFIYANGNTTELGVLPGFDTSSGRYINNAGEVVGDLTNSNQPGANAFVYVNGQMFDLNSIVNIPGETLAHVDGLNNNGQILVTAYPGINYAGPTTNYLLTPVSSTTATPEPSTFGLLMGGLLVMFVSHTRKAKLYMPQRGGME